LIDTPITSVACDADPTGDAGAAGSGDAGETMGLASKVGDPLSQHRHEVGHHMDHRALDTEQIGVEVRLADAITDLSREPCIELIFGYSFED
jgi:hypothetical protein